MFDQSMLEPYYGQHTVQYVSLILFYMMHTLRYRAHAYYRHHLGAKSSSRFNRSVKLARPRHGSFGGIAFSHFVIARINRP